MDENAVYYNVTKYVRLPVKLPLLDRISRAARYRGISRNQYIRNAIVAALRADGYEASDTMKHGDINRIK